MTNRVFRVLSPTAILGYGFPEKSFRRGMEKCPDLIAIDAGSTDPGPYYLGVGKSFTSRQAVKRDLCIILKAAVETNIPCIIGSAGGSGARPHVDWTENIIREIATEQGISFRMAVIYADIDKDTICNALRCGHIQPLYPVPDLRHEDIEKSVRIVAQMGVEPVINALEKDCQIILCGRCYDPIPFAAPALREGYNPGLAIHMGKILECAAIAASPGSGRDCVMGSLSNKYFELETLNDERCFTKTSTAAHTMYEKTNPYSLPGPGGTLDLSETFFETIDGGRIRVSGTRFIPALPYTVKLEGVKSTGFRTISIGGIRDPIFIKSIDSVLDDVRKLVQEELGNDGKLIFHIYGKNGVMGRLEPERDRVSHELGIVIEVVTPDQAQSDFICSYVRSSLLHFGYPGRISTAGNLALLYSPSDIACGEVYEFNIYHLMTVDDPTCLFPIHVHEVHP
ncbi:MAG: acyclic terpene utilization AtuA family protein [Syntrophaceae bacterium]